MDVIGTVCKLTGLLLQLQMLISMEHM